MKVIRYSGLVAGMMIGGLLCANPGIRAQETIRDIIRERIKERIRQRRQGSQGSAEGERSAEEHSFEFGGRTRTYLLHLPSGYTSEKSWPLVIVLHGGGGTAAGAVRMSDMSAKADKEGFIAVYPSGTAAGPAKHFTWNSFNCCGYALKQNVDDVGFVRALIEKLEKENNVAPERIYATGLSNGALLTYKLACDLSDKIAAAAPVAGALNGECHPARPVAMVIFHGTADGHVPYNGGYGKASFVKHEDKPVSYAVSFWAKNNGCSGALQRKEYGSIVEEDYAGCKDGADVVLYTIKGQGHAWPGGKPGPRNGNVDPPTQEISATEILWDFFSRHPRK